MAVEPQDAIFSLTPPPSDIDDLDLEKNGLLTCSPTLTGLCYPSPTPSNRGHPSSVSSDSLYLLPELPILDHHTQQLADMAYNTTSSDSSSYYPLPAVSDPSLSHYSTTSGAISNATLRPLKFKPLSGTRPPTGATHSGQHHSANTSGHSTITLRFQFCARHSTIQPPFDRFTIFLSCIASQLPQPQKQYLIVIKVMFT
ncbi:hypothetical protein LTR84_002189 [Exophiala bonariae]|uniref:Uncharacterized protein n=1 Tax=Exophiala bonariae TaxID=1690606 RepID=A0AAV9NE72_9EURO|nr:hypothetical protein LTR84_002189 [Exophiala bonariae]